MRTFAKFIITPIFVILIIFAIFYVDLWIRFKHEAVMTKQLMRRFTPGTVEYETYKRWNNLAKLYYLHANKAKEYENRMEYGWAIKEYEEALNTGYDNWMAHWHLVDLYEKAGYCDLALQEIDWLILKKPSQRVMDELNNRKKKLETLLKDVVK